ncbi:MAG: 2-oxoacid:acceptor oxidoreductase family protein [candidate division KSB1 bacterium]|nr:2-oxoacid:acceptor oxidoreductase family protein [candidate division KSB1 bacterium]
MFGVGLAQAGMQAGYHVSWIPSYGPEMRGGTANCNVNLSDEHIGSPVVSRPNVLIAFNLPSLDKFESQVQSGGLIFYNQSMIDRDVKRDDVEAIAIPATEMAEKIGDARIANMFVLGAYIERTGVLDQQTLIDSLPHFIKRKNLIPLNEKAIQEGGKWMKNTLGN